MGVGLAGRRRPACMFEEGGSEEEASHLWAPASTAPDALAHGRGQPSGGVRGGGVWGPGRAEARWQNGEEKGDVGRRRQGRGAIGALVEFMIPPARASRRWGGRRAMGGERREEGGHYGNLAFRFLPFLLLPSPLLLARPRGPAPNPGTEATRVRRGRGQSLGAFWFWGGDWTGRRTRGRTGAE